jgi:acyl transferase domain-containing protein
MTQSGPLARRPGVAITGMACMFPGAPDVDAYWSNILGKVDSTSEPPPEAWDPAIYYDPEFSDHDRTYVQRGGYLGLPTMRCSMPAPPSSRTRSGPAPG